MPIECLLPWAPTEPANQTQTSYIGRALSIAIGLGIVIAAVMSLAHFHWWDGSISYILLAGSSLPLIGALFARHVTRLEADSGSVYTFPIDLYSTHPQLNQLIADYYKKALREIYVPGQKIYLLEDRIPGEDIQFYAIDAQGKFETGRKASRYGDYWDDGEQVF